MSVLNLMFALCRFSRSSRTHCYRFAAALLFFNVSAGLLAQSAPKILSVSPADGAVGASTNSSIVFVFDQDMDTLSVVPIASFPPAFIGNFEVSPSSVSFLGNWGADKRTLTLKPLTKLPADTVISWKLNPPGATFIPSLASATHQLLATVAGSFRTEAPPVLGPTPKLIAVTPASGATNIDPSASVTFAFDLDMDTNVTLVASLPPVFPGNYQFQPSTVAMSQGTWSADKRILSFTPIAPILPGTIVSWTLNPAGSTTPLKSAAGQALATTSGTYQVIFNNRSNTVEECVGTNFVTNGFYTLNKTISHTQLSSDRVVLAGQNPAIFGVFIQSPPLSGSLGGQVASASLMLPGGATFDITNLFGNLFFSDSFLDENALDSQYPAGTYQLQFTQQRPRAAAEEHTIPMDLPATFTSIPAIVNFAQAQTIDPAQSFVLKWNAFSPQGPGAFIRVLITDAFGNIIFQAPNACVPRSLAATDTAVTVPADYLKAGFNYSGLLQFGLNFYNSTNDVPGMVGYGAIVRSTSFPLKAISGGGNTGGIVPPSFAGYRLLPNGHPQLDLSGSAGRVYTVRRSGTLTNPNWVNLGTVTMSAGGTAVFEDGDSSLQFPAFYEALFLDSGPKR